MAEVANRTTMPVRGGEGSTVQGSADQIGDQLNGQFGENFNNEG